MVLQPMKDVLNCAIMTSGVRSVMMDGMMMMLLLPADKPDTP